MKFSELVENKKHVRQKTKKYGLVSQKKIPYFKSEELLRNNGFVINERNVNSLFCNNGNESIKHFLVKSIIFKILRERKRRVGTEIEVKTGIVDILDLDSMIAYEIETNLTKQKIREKLLNLISVKDVFFIDTREVPDDIFEAEKYLKEKIV